MILSQPLALRKYESNYKGTGGGAGQELTSAEQNAMHAMISRRSNIVNGIPGAVEVGTEEVAPLDGTATEASHVKEA